VDVRRQPAPRSSVRSLPTRRASASATRAMVTRSKCAKVEQAHDGCRRSATGGPGALRRASGRRPYSVLCNALTDDRGARPGGRSGWRRAAERNRRLRVLHPHPCSPLARPRSLAQRTPSTNCRISSDGKASPGAGLDRCEAMSSSPYFTGLTGPRRPGQSRRARSARTLPRLAIGSHRVTTTGAYEPTTSSCPSREQITPG